MYKKDKKNKKLKNEKAIFQTFIISNVEKEEIIKEKKLLVWLVH